MLIYERARQEAEQILQGVKIDSHGLDSLKRIASQWEAKVIVMPLEEGLSGAIIKENDSPPHIYINSTESLLRQRFTLAHEIGHLIDRGTVARDPDYSFIDKRGGKYDLHEFFADEFADALLMPEEDINKKKEEGKSNFVSQCKPLP